MQYHFVNACINSSTNASTSCKNFVNIGPVTSEFKKGVCGIVAGLTIFAYLARWYSEMDWNIAADSAEQTILI